MATDRLVDGQRIDVYLERFVFEFYGITSCIRHFTKMLPDLMFSGFLESVKRVNFRLRQIEVVRHKSK